MLEAGWNTYAYVGSNPVTGKDPWGLIEYEEVGKRKRGSMCSGPVICSIGYYVDIRTPRGGQVNAFFSDSLYSPRIQNCHGYALDIPAWINDPSDIYKKEFIRVNNMSEADIGFYRNRLSDKPKHSAKFVGFFRVEKFGIFPRVESLNKKDYGIDKPEYYRYKRGEDE